MPKRVGKKSGIYRDTGCYYGDERWEESIQITKDPKWMLPGGPE